MQYKANEVSRILNISIDSLRYYEKLGVITPKIDEKNHYRYYDAWDINYLLEYLYYRKMDYSSQEILEFIHGDTLDAQIAKVREKLDYYREKKEYYDYVYDKNRNFLASLKEIREGYGGIQIIPCRSYRYLVYRHNYKFNQKREMNQVFSQWMKYYFMVHNLVLIGQDTVERRLDNEYDWSFALLESDFSNTELTENEYVKSVSSGLCVRTIVDAGDHGMFHYRLLDPAMDFMEKHCFEMNGDPFGILLTRVHESDGYHRYIEFFIPIKV